VTAGHGRRAAGYGALAAAGLALAAMAAMIAAAWGHDWMPPESRWCCDNLAPGVADRMHDQIYQ
jgi:hypothetical protein